MKGRLSKKNVRKNTKNTKNMKNTKYTKNNKRQTKRKTMKMRKTRKERKIRPQVGGMKLDGLLYQALKDKDGEYLITLYKEYPDEYWYLENRNIFQDFVGDQVDNNDQGEYLELLDVMDQYKYDKFNELKESFPKIPKDDASIEDWKRYGKKMKNEARDMILRIINPNDLSRDISIIKDGKRQAETLEL